jgi:hypothetical protein
LGNAHGFEIVLEKNFAGSDRLHDLYPMALWFYVNGSPESPPEQGRWLSIGKPIATGR